MARYLKASTAVTVMAGPFLDAETLAAMTSLTITQAGVRLSKNGGAFAQKNQTSSATHDENGYYTVQLNATDTNTTGILTVAIQPSGALPWHKDYVVLPAQVYDSLVAGSDLLDVNAAEVGGAVPESSADIAAEVWDTALSSHTASGSAGQRLGRIPNAAAGGAGGLPTLDSNSRVSANVTAMASAVLTSTAISDGAITAAKIASDAITASKIASDAITAAKIASDAITASKIAAEAITAAKIASNAITAAKIASDTITADKIASNAITAAKIATNAIGADQIATSAVSEIQAGLSTLDGAGVRSAVGLASANLDMQLSGLSNRLPASLNNGCIQADVQRINDVEIIGDGSDIPFTVAGS